MDRSLRLLQLFLQLSTQFARIGSVPGVLGAFARSRRGIAAVEFALVLPFMIILTLGSIEVARLIIFTRKIELVANTAVEMLSQNNTPAPSNASQGVVNFNDLHFTQGATLVIFPQILQDAANKGVEWSNDIAISMASIQFTPTPSTCTTSCTYKANVIWNSGPNPRPCGTSLTPVADTNTPTPTTLPTDVYGPGTILAVDIVYTYTPLFIQTIFGSIKIARSAFLAPRYKPQGIVYQVISGDDKIGAECPGF
jgi:Flp pilus assembly protein TadG